MVEHDLSVLDYLSDFICCLYGKPGAYGVVTLPFSVREGINIFLAGFVPTENLRFREESLTFKVAENAGEGDDDVKKFARYTYPTMSKTQVQHVVHQFDQAHWSSSQGNNLECQQRYELR